MKKLFGKLPENPKKLDPAELDPLELDSKLNRYVGTFMRSIYSQDDSFSYRIRLDLSNHFCNCCASPRQSEEGCCAPTHKKKKYNNQAKESYTTQIMLRDLFLWSVFMDMPEMAKVLLVHIHSRVCAALVASAIFKKYSRNSNTVYLKEKFQNQSLEFETYAATFINKCHEYNEKLACEILLREIPLFGCVTCMQVNIKVSVKVKYLTIFVGGYSK